MHLFVQERTFWKASWEVETPGESNLHLPTKGALAGLILFGAARFLSIPTSVGSLSLTLAETFWDLGTC